MHELRPIKFIIYQGELLIARVDFHRELLPEEYSKGDVKGGGFAIVNSEERTLEVSGKSEEFGYYDQDLINSVKLPKRLSGFSIIENQQYP